MPLKDQYPFICMHHLQSQGNLHRIRSVAGCCMQTLQLSSSVSANDAPDCMLVPGMAACRHGKANDDKLTIENIQCLMEQRQ
jgi:hypothetical protein